MKREGLLTRAANRAARRLRADPDYRLDPDLSAGALLAEAGVRVVALLRAQVRLLGVSGSPLRFVEPRVKVRHRRRCTVGRGSVLETGSQLLCLSRQGIRLGERVTVGRYTVIECTGVLWNLGLGCTVGPGSAIGDYGYIGAAGGVRIGADVLIGQRVSMHAEQHSFDDPDRPIRAQGVTNKGIDIGDGCWLGAGVVILDGVTLGDGCVVGAGSVVTRSFPAGAVVTGVPAQLVRMRGDKRND